eukprot:1143716-Pelagomonas_calceolata.AAC.1
MAAPSIKTGTYLPSDPQARCKYPWMDRQSEDHFLLETHITRADTGLTSLGMIPKGRGNGFTNLS